jgi:hypothetical protein
MSILNVESVHPLSKEEVKLYTKFVTKKAIKTKNFRGLCQVSSYFEGLRYYSAKTFNPATEEPNVLDIHDIILSSADTVQIDSMSKELRKKLYSGIYTFKINFIPGAQKSNKGGNGGPRLSTKDYIHQQQQNDCLFNALQKAVNKLPVCIQTPEALRKYIGVNPGEMIPLEKAKKVQDAFGDKVQLIFIIEHCDPVIPRPRIKTAQKIHILLHSEHYEHIEYKLQPIDKSKDRIDVSYFKTNFPEYPQGIDNFHIISFIFSTVVQCYTNFDGYIFYANFDKLKDDFNFIKNDDEFFRENMLLPESVYKYIRKVFKNITDDYDYKKALKLLKKNVIRFKELREFDITIDIDEFVRLKKTNRYKFVAKDRKMSLSETYENFIIARDKILKYTTMSRKELSKLSGNDCMTNTKNDNKPYVTIDLCKYKSEGQCAMNIFKMMSPSCYTPDPIGIVEGNLLHKIFKGGLTYAEKGYNGPAYVYDIRSYYLYLLTQSKFNLPVTNGYFEKLESTDYNTKKIYTDKYGKEYESYPEVAFGIYKCTIDKSDDENINKLFMFADNNTYTHYDLRCAQDLGLKINLKTDSEWNAYLYIQKQLTMNGSYYFSNFVSSLYELKNLVKEIKYQCLNPLWGYMCRRNTMKKIVNRNSSEDLFVEGYQFESIESIDDEMYTVISSSHEKPFKTNFARLVFITSYSRYMLAKRLLPYKDLIVRIHTDSMTLTKPVHDYKGIPGSLKLGNKIGDWHIEKEKSGLEVNIIHVNSCKQIIPDPDI